jgi:hypothetical protein
MAKLDIERGKFDFLFGVVFDGQLKRMTKVEATIAMRCGEEWLNSGAAKDAAFGLLRTMTDLTKPEGIVFATATNAFRPTQLFLERYPDPDVQKAMLDRGHDHHHEMVAEGLLKLDDSITVVAQTAESVCIGVQVVVDGKFDGQANFGVGPQADFGGRLKMYGEESQHDVKIICQLRN